MWVHWLIEETKALLVFYDSFNALEINVTDIKNSIDVLLQFLGVFSQVSDNVCSEYIDTLLTCAKVLPVDEFDQYYKQLDNPQAVSFCASALPLSEAFPRLGGCMSPKIPFSKHH